MTTHRQPQKCAGSEKKGTVLIVDDEKVIRDLCVRALGEYTVSQAATTAEAIHIYSAERNDLVLSDVMMPGDNGIELLKRIKELDPMAAVIIMTGFAEKEVILNALREGADDFISKPLNLLQLRTTVEKALSKKQLKEELANLKQLDRLKSNFLSLISHKLRTPITAISLFLQNIQRGVYEKDDEQFQKNLALINEETDYLNRMVNDLIGFSQVMEGNGTLHREQCDLNLIMNWVLQNSREAQLKPGVETEFSETELPPIHLDKSKISFALQQIVDNAYKFSKETGQVSIIAESCPGGIAIKICDSGIGVPRDELTKIFDKFYQVDPDGTGQVRGFGLGLFYAREFIRQHGGQLSIESELGWGTIVTVTLPLM